MQKAIEAHDRTIEKVQNRINSMDGSNDPKKVKESIGTNVRLQKAIETHKARIENLPILQP
jgi:hypothetical protein